MSRSKAAILAQWEQAENPTAGITSKQRDTILEISEKAANRPWPVEIDRLGSEMPQSMTSSTNLGLFNALPQLDNLSNDSKSEVNKPSSGAKSMVSSANSESDQHISIYPAVKILEKGGRIESGHQFLEWLHQVERNLIFQEDSPYRYYISQMEKYRADADVMLHQVEGGLEQLKKLGEQHNFVANKSNSLHTACQHLLQEQTNMVAVSEKIAEKLKFFTEADKINQKLQSTTFSVKSESFPDVLDKIDECLLYILDHASYKQSNVYRVKYNACLSRALGMIRSHVKATFDNATVTALNSAGNQSAANSADSSFPLFYGKFRAQAPRITSVIQAIEKRTSTTRTTSRGSSAGEEEETRNATHLWHEYESVLADLQAMYFSCRSQLLVPSVRNAITDLSVKYKRDHCGMIRSGCAFLLHICEDEYNLFHQFFKEDSENLSSFVESLCQILYDTLRPLVIHLHHLETLSEITGILRSEMIGHYCASHPAQLMPFERIITQLLQDVQERLVYRAYIYIRTDILGYTPAPGDLAYPEKLEMMESIAESLQQQQFKAPGRQRQNSGSSLVSATSIEVAQINGGKTFSASNSPADLHGMWYPPVRRTLVCLSKLYRCLEREIFQGLSQEALSACMDAVANAADMISERKKNKMDGQLFQIKHLLILREQIAPFHVDFSVKETSVDFTKMKSAAWTMLKKRGDMFNMNSSNALLEFLLDGTPEVKEYCRDSRKEVDKQLKGVCEKFIATATSGIVAPIQVFLNRVEGHRKSDKTLNISRESWATPTVLNDVIAQCQRSLKKQFPLIQRAMQLYLANKETEFILFRPIRNNVMTSFISFLQLTRQNYNQDEQIIIGCPTQEQIAMMITSLQLQPKTPRSSTSKETRSPPPPNSIVTPKEQDSKENIHDKERREMESETNAKEDQADEKNIDLVKNV